MLSVIIPVLNEAKTLEKTLLCVQTATDIEIIVVDGGSTDNSIAIAKEMDAKVIFSEKGRATQMNTGAALAQGDTLLFLHGDTLLPLNYQRLIEEALIDSWVVAGAFELKIDLDKFSIRLVEMMVKARSRFLSLPYGDQAIFVRTSVFKNLGGFPQIPIMEDFELIKRLQRQGKIALIPIPVITSGRRWQKLGVAKTTLINQTIILGYYCGVSPDSLASWYRKRF